MNLKPDSVTEWRIHQVALAENRSFTNALATMISEAWSNRMAAATTKSLMHGVSHEEPAPTGEVSATVAAHLDGALIGAVKKVAKAENRSVSSTIGALIRQAIELRA